MKENWKRQLELIRRRKVGGLRKEGIQFKNYLSKEY